MLNNCAGYFPMVPFEKMTAQDWQRVIDINLTGTFLVTQAVLPLMKDRGWGRIVNFRSGSVFDGTPGHAHYVAAKAGVVGFSRSLAREVGDYGITVNVVTPRPDGGRVFFLASSDSAFISGQTLNIDGGMFMP